MPTITLADLRQILVECAGEDEDADQTGDISDVPFTELGYDSLALIETAAQIQQRFGVTIADDRIGELETPRALLELVNGSLADAR